MESFESIEMSFKVKTPSHNGTTVIFIRNSYEDGKLVNCNKKKMFIHHLEEVVYACFWNIWLLIVQKLIRNTSIQNWLTKKSECTHTKTLLFRNFAHWFLFYKIVRTVPKNCCNCPHKCDSFECHCRWYQSPTIVHVNTCAVSYWFRGSQFPQFHQIHCFVRKHCHNCHSHGECDICHRNARNTPINHTAVHRAAKHKPWKILNNWCVFLSFLNITITLSISNTSKRSHTQTIKNRPNAIRNIMSVGFRFRFEMLMSASLECPCI